MKSTLFAVVVCASMISGFAEASKSYGQVARGYTEVLGRTPDVTGYTGTMTDVKTHSCNIAKVKALSKSFLTSTEFTNMSLDNRQRVFVAFRMITFGDPASTTDWDTYTTQLDNATKTFSQIVDTINSATVNTSFKNAVCANTKVPTSTQQKFDATYISSKTGGTIANQSNAASLETALNAASSGDTIEIKQSATIDVDRTLVLPPGVTLRTYGSPTHFAIQARLRRKSGFTGPMIKATDGGKISNLWIDGGGNFQSWIGDNPSLRVLGQAGTAGTNDELRIYDNKFSSAAGNSAIHTKAAGSSIECTGLTHIEGNVITSYSSAHTGGNYTDGIRVGSCNNEINDNVIVDATDVGIVIFRADDDETQDSEVYDNVILQSHLSGYSAITIDSLGSNVDSLQPGSSGYFEFDGTDVHDNEFGSAPDVHFDLPFSVGTRAWFGTTTYLARDASFTDNDDSYVVYEGNSDGVVAGMYGATVTGNSINPVTVKTIGNCTGNTTSLWYESASTSGTIQTPKVNKSFTSGCVSH